MAAAALGMDKLAFGGLMVAAGLPTLPRVALTADTDEARVRGAVHRQAPLRRAPPSAYEVVEDLATARALLPSNVHLRGGAVLEPFRPDLYDVQVALRRWPETQVSAIERPLRSPGRAGRRPGRSWATPTSTWAVRAWPARHASFRPNSRVPSPSAFAGRPGGSPIWPSVRGVARLDFLTDGDELVVNEINTIPGSLARYLWIDPDVPFARLLGDMIAEAAAVPTARYSAAGADGLVLRGASSIAAKLA